jgi:hypothetical protein
MRWWMIVTAVLCAAGAEGEAAGGHQRVAAVQVLEHRWSGDLALAWVPAGESSWDLRVTPRWGYEAQETWMASVAAPVHWTQAYGQTRFQWGEADLGFRWRFPGEPRWTVRATASGPCRPQPDQCWFAGTEAGVTWVVDPVLVGLSLQGAAPLPGLPRPRGTVDWSAGAEVSFQEVLNDRCTWSLVWTPQVAALDGLLYWSLTVSWSVGWFAERFSTSTGASWGTFSPLTWTATGGTWW